ncbi:MAG: ABC transporter ATP-binding protein [Gemmatimonadetes bacterium]|nr:ABC transporter ATP-binding protein [Gemmatimonadota bacterium]MYA77612.1 ABC transporter ATP-binding protein [Gemmatimonadota bacterium]MYG17939.1 ABC transporter ATP-binding protein [Gemmatimonadota bacterium]MYH19207.1 ABC transporter ATP-binding protein [Gemmatimonadota bacterium]MYK99227.1 ABC transporter ATP-binding protein [Gemmatimonadota bacterium]
MSLAIDIRHLRFRYGGGPWVLDIPEVTLERGTRAFLFGPSGSGKTTLLGVLAGVLEANEGDVTVLGEDLTSLSGPQRDAFRAEHIGYVFQMFNLIPYLSVLDNITLPVRMHAGRRARLDGTGVKESAAQLAGHLHIGDLLKKPVTELSVGQQQRVAACRALIGAPELIVADEPTSSLDVDRREDFLDLLFQECERAGATLVFVSHDRTLEGMFSRTISLPDVNKAVN